MILAIDSSAGTSVALVSMEGVTRHEASSDNPRGHAEVVGNLIDEVLESAGVTPADLTAVVMGVGPGPFTGLRVGMAAASAVSWAREIPLWPVVSMDAAVYGRSGRFLVWSDQKRKERAFVVYDVSDGLPIAVSPPALHPVADFAEIERRNPGVEVVEQGSVSAADLVRVALERRNRGLDLSAPHPLYLRPPDVTL
jgi:tRNA threonylcarbamoyladenosine biosynthesis protein TsaB